MNISNYIIPYDIISDIYKYLTYKDCLSLTCKIYNKIYKCHANLNFNKIKLKYSQYLALCQIEEKIKLNNEVILCAPYGFGKTITSLYYAFKMSEENILIITPPNLINKVWIPELTKLNLYHANPDKSEVLVLYNARPKHCSKNIDDTLQTLFLSHRVILTSYNKALKLKGVVPLIIVDEAHKYYVQVACNKQILLTAEQKFRENKDNFIYAGVINKEIIPEVKYKWYSVKNDNIISTYASHIDNFRRDITQFKKLIRKAVTKYDKTCLFVDRGEIGMLVNEILTDLNEYKLFTVKSSFESVLEKHLKYKGKSILLLPSNANEGINLLIDNIIIIKPEIYSTTRLKQTICRLLRPNNPNKKVTVSFVTDGIYGTLKTLYGVIYLDRNWTFGYEDSPNKEVLYKSHIIAKLLGYDKIVKNINIIDYCVIFDNHNRNYNTILQWWNKYKTHDSKLSEDIIKTFYL